ncbi:single-stranded DNA-binding protein [Acidiphilium sp. AL]|uniref:Single-stranded DNA-binding protein n=1 Tax=Acidiphilium iwatense TaxID=768198 RepID=A0ABS9DYA1_9PROT|nr:MULTISPECIES: single-stranded DNA-binding protein [Acidiphilium]MCF3946780.1 single-stranded DNA-binding protein [Acidiphilium iwatense]MCU4158749.1 single-stranded DNA-binding protein [Acidiphilium sp. AL]
MAGSVNKVTLIGNLGKDPEVRTTQSGMKIVNLAVATSETWNDKTSGERQERTEWHRVVIMNDRLADVAERFLKKGSKVYLEGKLQTRKWTDQSGQEKYTTEVMLGRIGAELVLLDRANASGGGDDMPRGNARAAGGYGGGQAAPRSGGWDAGKSGADLDDEIPF